MTAEAGDLQGLAGAPLLHLTTIGRRTKYPRTVELWFASQEGCVYLLGHPDSHWVQNLVADPRVTMEVDGVAFAGTARVADSKRTLVYELFQKKYGTEQIAYWYSGAHAQRRTIEIALTLTAH